MNQFLLKSRLAIMLLLEFAVWGAYLTSLGSYLAGVGLPNHIGPFYAVQGIVSIFTPAIFGIIADRWIPAQKMLSLSHLFAGLFMIAAGVYGYLNPPQILVDGHWEVVASIPDEILADPSLYIATPFMPLFTLYAISVGFFMPTIGLANSVSYNALDRAGLDTVKHFPPIRIFGTIGFIILMLFVNFTGFQNTYAQLITSGIASLLLMAYALTMPECPVNKSGAKKSLSEALGLNAFKLFKNRNMAIFFIFSMLLGVSLQITNGFANPFIKSFGEDTLIGRNANALISLSQMSETLCILLIPFFLRKFGIKVVMLMAMFAWVLRFGFFGIGDATPIGITYLVLSMIVYGVAFDFFNVSGSLYVDQQTDISIRSSAQGLFMIMTNGIGATVGTLGAQAIITKFVNSQTGQAAVTAGWHTSWLIFAAYSLVVAVLFIFIFKNKPAKTSVDPKTVADEDPAGMVDPV
ncbi:MAG: MFS transporter [Muribaculaceae bacterium]|nr:MFS transporter [Muribaculaceae bacterium]